MYRYVPRHALKSLRTSIESFAPDIIVPLCDRSVQHLHGLHAKCSTEGEHGRQIRQLIERSLGPANSFSIVSSRYDLMMLAKDAGIRVPETVRIDSFDDLRRWKSGWPCLLKADGTSCGLGVRRAETLTCGEEALRELANRTSVYQLVKRLLMFRDRALTISNWTGERPGIIAQAFVPGRPANCSVVCWRGEILAGIAVEVVQTDGPMEPAFIVQIVEGREMLEAAKRIARRLELTGFFGLDFMLEESTDKLYLIEMNPRCTPPCSLNLGAGRDLVGAFWARVAEREMLYRPAITQKNQIAYFPTAVRRGAVSLDGPEPDSVYVDIPSGQPELVHALLHPWPDRSLAGRAVDQLRRNLPLKDHLRQMSSRLRNGRNAATAGGTKYGPETEAASPVRTQKDWS
jgi:hypothetical protein